MGLWKSLISALGLGGSAAGADFYDKLLQLAPGETIVSSVGGRFVVGEGREVTFGDQYLLAVTSTGRLVLGDMMTMSPALARSFAPGAVRVSDRGYLDQDGGIVSGRSQFRVAGPTGEMERTKILSLVPANAAPFAICAPESAVAPLLAWAARDAGASPAASAPPQLP